MVEPPVTAEFQGLLLSRVAVPRWRERWLRRPRVDDVLAVAGEARLTVLAAPAGYGKTVALAGLADRGGWPLVWCRAAAEPARAFLAHLAAACASLVPAAANARTPASLVNALVRGLDDETIIVIDDAERLSDEAAELVGWLVERLPEQAHLVVAGRRSPLASLLAAFSARGDAASVGKEELAFTDDEAAQLFEIRRRGEPTSIMAASAGWPIAVDLAARLGAGAAADAALAAFVEREVLAPLAEPDRRTLLALAAVDDRAVQPALFEVLGRSLDEEALEALGAPADRGQLVPAARAALRRIAQREATWWRGINRQIAERLGDTPAALNHWLLAGADVEACSRFERGAERWLANEPAQVADWFDRLCHHGMSAAAALTAARANRAIGRIARAVTIAEKAQQAAVGDPAIEAAALHLLAGLFLDTVEPRRARPLLRRARRLLDPDDPRCAENVRLQIECSIDAGQPALARRLSAMAGEGEPPRLLLRTGRLVEARAAIETVLGVGSPGGVLAAHREPALLLAYVDAALGSGARALAMAQRGILEAQQAGHRLTEAVAWIRLGHAQQVAAPLEPGPAIRAYETAIACARSAGIERTEAEAYLGLLLARGHAGDVPRAQEAFEQAVGIAERAGDRWLAAWAAAARASVSCANDEPDAMDHLARAEARICRVEDDFGRAVVALWRAIHAIEQGEESQTAVDALFTLVERHKLEGLLTGPSLYGPRDTAALIPVLLRARSTRFESLAEHLLRTAFPTVASDGTVTDYHPGFTLRVQLLGVFRVWRGRREVAAREWQREKAKQLFKLLVTYRGRWLQREQICSLLWPDADPEAAEGQFKVALNALNAAIEPRRPPRVAPFFVRRNGLAYAFAPASGVWIDVDEFDLRVESAARGDDAFATRALSSAVALYQGDFLAESLYDPWTHEERNRLLARYLAAALDLGNRLLQHGETAEALALGETVLRRDRADERAHQLLMRAHALNGDRQAAVRVYRRCQQALAEELGVEPLPETTALFERIRRGLPISS
ncbi:MAG: transcriptional activator [Dehalococcoidia bacterium]|nr:MAG: transcriptional activator [Dehalococcoidia bacterium]